MDPELTRTLTETEREQGIRALFATLYSRHTSTADLAGHIVSGSLDPHEDLINLLLANGAGWAGWLSAPAHHHAAESMTSALTDEDMLRLENDIESASLFDVLNTVRQERAVTRSLSANSGEDAVIIDLRDAEKAHL